MCDTLKELNTDLQHQVNAALVGQPIKVIINFTGALGVRIQETPFLNLKSHPVNISDKFVRMVQKLAPKGYKVSWNNTGSCFWLVQV